MAESLELLIPASAIEQRVAEIAATLSGDYGRDDNLLVIAVLNGAAIFLADLVRRMTIPVTVDFLRVKSYGPSTESTGVVRIRKNIECSPMDRHVLLVEDIVDTGLTLRFLSDHLLASRPKSLEVCTLLDKPSRRLEDVRPKYIGFTIQDAFVVGYGMDFQERYRQLPDINVLRGAAAS